MDLFPIVLLIACFFIGLFTLYTVSNDDFILLRKHITVTKIFDIAFLTVIVGLFAARLFYVVFHFSPGFLNPLVFFLFPYFPGLSLSGGIIGGVILLIIYSFSGKLPAGRIFDIFSLSLFSTLPLGLVMEFIVSKKVLPSFFLLGGACIALVVYINLFRHFQKGTNKDGSISFLFLASFSLIMFLTHAVGREKTLFLLTYDTILLALLFIVSTFLFIQKEKPFARIWRFFRI